MITGDTMLQLEQLGFGSDIDKLEEYVMTLQDSAGEYNPIVTDTTYDMYRKLLEKLKPESVALKRNWEKDDNDFTEDDEILKVYGMKSITTITDLSELDFFRAKLEEYYMITGQPVVLHSGTKLNGHAIRAVYKYGKLIGGSTRGRYKKGRDISRHLKRILPNYIDAWSKFELVEVRGEALVSTATFKSKLQGVLKTRLSSVTSLIKESATDDEIDMLDIVCYKCIISNGSTDNSYFNTLEDEYKELEQRGFKIPIYKMYYDVTPDNLDSVIMQIIADYEKMYDNNVLEYDCDGIVVGINDLATFYNFGSKDNALAGNFAVKMGRVWESKTYMSVIEEIEWTPNKAYIVPKANITPVVAKNGSTVTTVPLYNIGVMQKLHLVVGSKIYFKYGGETGVTLVTEDGISVSKLIGA